MELEDFKRRTLEGAARCGRYILPIGLAATAIAQHERESVLTESFEGGRGEHG